MIKQIVNSFFAECTVPSPGRAIRHRDLFNALKSYCELREYPELDVDDWRDFHYASKARHVHKIVSAKSITIILGLDWREGCPYRQDAPVYDLTGHRLEGNMQ